MKFDVGIADCPWPYNSRSATDSFRGGACTKYNLMSLNDIAALPIADLFTKDAMLFFWVTGPHLMSAAQVLDGWGFDYTTFAFIWVKTNLKKDTPFFGTGYYTKANAEVMLLARRKRGRPLERMTNTISQIVETQAQLAAFDGEWDSDETDERELQSVIFDNHGLPGFECPTIYHPRMKHSRKPDIFHQKIEELHGDVPRVELFARRRYPGWVCLGNEIDGRDMTEAVKWTQQSEWYHGDGHLLYERKLQMNRMNMQIARARR